MKKIKDNELTELNGGMTCSELTSILRYMTNYPTATSQSIRQAADIVDLMHSGYTLCYG